MNKFKDKLDKILIKLKLKEEKTEFQKNIESIGFARNKLKPISELTFFSLSMCLVVGFVSQLINLISLGGLQFFSWSSVINDTVIALVFSVLIFSGYLITESIFGKRGKFLKIIYAILFFVFVSIILGFLDANLPFEMIKNYYLIGILFTVGIIICILDFITFFWDKKYRGEKVYYIISIIIILSITVGTEFFNSKFKMIIDNEEYSITYTNDNYIFLENGEIFKNSNTLHLKEINNSNFFCKKFNKMCDDDKKETKDQ